MNSNGASLILAIMVAISPAALSQPYLADTIPVSTRPELVELSTHYTFPFKPAAWPIGAGLLSGVYKPEREDRDGVFYRGQNRSVVVRGLEGKTSVKRYALMVGGFWMPKDGQSKPRIYFYVEKTYPSVDDLLELAMPADAPKDMDAAKVLATENSPTMVGSAVNANPAAGGAALGRTVFGASIGAALVDAYVLASITGNEGKINYWWMPIDDKDFLNGLSQAHSRAVQGSAWPGK